MSSMACNKSWYLKEEEGATGENMCRLKENIWIKENSLNYKNHILKSCQHTHAITHLAMETIGNPRGNRKIAIYSGISNWPVSLVTQSCGCQPQLIIRIIYIAF